MDNSQPRRACPPHILEAYKNGDFTDLKITCNPLEFEVHRVVVAPPCEFFTKTLRFSGKEAEEKCIDLPEDDPDMIRRLIAYLYLDNYEPCNEGSIASFGNIKQHVSTTIAAPAYHRRKGGVGSLEGSEYSCACLAPNTTQLDQPKSETWRGLIDPALEKPGNSIEVNNPLTIHATMYALADKYHVDGLSDVAKAKFESCLYHHVNSEDFVTAVQIAYSSTPDSNRGLRDAVVNAFLVHFQVKIKEVPGLEAKLDTIDELSFLLIKSWPNKTLPKKTKKSKPVHVPQVEYTYDS